MTTRPYRPSNGTEGEAFTERFCCSCVYDRNSNCSILTRTLINRIGHPDYPAEWVQDDVPFPNNNPRCTAFIKMNRL